MNILRMEKKYLHWGHDISPEEKPYEVGLNMFVSLKKSQNFIGRQIMEKNLHKDCNKRLVFLTLENSENPGSPLLLHEEPIYMNNKIVGKTTSGNYSFYFKKNMSIGLIKLDDNFKIKDLINNQFEIEVAKKRYEAKLNLEPLHDPKNKYIRE
tara:strand:- start:48 stop:506 length:459 start_codon:yes stop_codon:yes gene_type:complete